MAAAPVSPEVAPRTLIDLAPDGALAGVEVAQELEGDVLEGERRTVEELEDVELGGQVQQRGDLRPVELAHRSRRPGAAAPPRGCRSRSAWRNPKQSSA